MATLKTHKRNGKLKGYEVAFGTDPYRHSVYLGKISKSSANLVTSMVTQLEKSRTLNTPAPVAATQWAEGLEDAMHAKFAKTGIVEPRTATTVEEQVERWLEIRKHSPNTATTIRSSAKRFYAVVGRDTLLRDLTQKHWEAFSDSMSDLSDSTKYTYLKNIKYALLDGDVVTAKIFASVRFKAAEVNKDRACYISRETIVSGLDRLLEHQTFENRERGAAYLACAGLLGMRCKSEPLALDWSDVNWANSYIEIPRVKTKARTCPLFSDGRKFLELWWISCGRPESGSVFSSVPCTRTVQRWLPRLFDMEFQKPMINLRSSCESHLINVEGLPVHEVTSWIGNSPRIFQNHYFQANKQIFDLALKVGVTG